MHNPKIHPVEKESGMAHQWESCRALKWISPSLEVWQVAEEKDEHVDGEAVDEVAEAPEDGARLRVPVDGVHEVLIDVILELENDMYK